MPGSALTQGTTIDLSITGTTANPSTDALRALCKVIDDYLDRVAAGETFTAIVGGGDEINVIETGDNPHVVYGFQLVATTDPDAVPAVFAVDYVGSANDSSGITFP